MVSNGVKRSVRGHRKRSMIFMLSNGREALRSVLPDQHEKLLDQDREASAPTTTILGAWEVKQRRSLDETGGFMSITNVCLENQKAKSIATENAFGGELPWTQHYLPAVFKYICILLSELSRIRFQWVWRTDESKDTGIDYNLHPFPNFGGLIRSLLSVGGSLYRLWKGRYFK